MFPSRLTRTVPYVAAAAIVLLSVMLWLMAPWWGVGAIYLASSVLLLTAPPRGSLYARSVFLFLAGATFAAGIGWLLWQSP